MPADVTTKADVSKGNAAQLQLLKTGMIRLTAEKDFLSHRRQDPSSKARSRAASSRQLSSPSSSVPRSTEGRKED
eukprot:3687665-Pyramimonas_sp.AAC.1